LRINTINDLAAVIRGRRLSLGLSQAQAALRAGVSRQWIGQLEQGKTTVEFGRVLGLLDALELNIELAAREGGGRSEASIDLDDLLDEYRDR
jgi:transcriptional regulator with XRE-family HTH domain